MNYRIILYALIAVMSADSSVATPGPENSGALEGIVVNGTRGEAPVADVEVALRVRFANRSAVVATTATDRYGAFRLDDLPLGDDYVYLPGASFGEVHHPGPRVRLTGDRPHARVKLVVYDQVSEPNPLVVSDQELTIREEAGALQVSESLVVENLSSTCYIGDRDQSDDAPVTLRLSIPDGVERITFDKEFFGRRFSVEGDELVTSIPWPPGRREIGFRYALPTTDRHIRWSRRLEVPCTRLRITVRSKDVDRVACNLDPVNRSRGEATYDAADVPAGRLVEVDFREMSVPFSVYGRWLSLAALVSLIGGASVVLVLRRERATTCRRR